MPHLFPAGAMLPPSMLMHMLVSLGSQVRPDPPGRWGRNAAPLGEWIDPGGGSPKVHGW